MTRTTMLQRQILAQARKFHHSTDPQVILLYLVEEVGEAIRAYMKETGYKKNAMLTESYAQELGDVYYMLLRLAGLTGVDLEKEARGTLRKVENRGK